MNLPLIDLITFCENKGYDVFPVKEGKFYVFTLWKGDQILKKGEKRYKTLIEGQREVYNKLYQIITK